MLVYDIKLLIIVQVVLVEARLLAGVCCYSLSEVWLVTEEMMEEGV